MVISFLRDEVGNESNISWKKDISLQYNEHCVLFEKDTLHRWMSCYNLLLFLKRYDSTFKTLYFIISITFNYKSIDNCFKFHQHIPYV